MYSSGGSRLLNGRQDGRSERESAAQKIKIGVGPKIGWQPPQERTITRRSFSKHARSQEPTQHFVDYSESGIQAASKMEKEIENGGTATRK